MRSIGVSKSRCASIISSPLFTREAESIVIFPPIFHVGCFSASSTVALAMRDASQLRKGPPLAVSQSRSTRSAGSPARHCQSAECSLSTGRSRSRSDVPLRAAARRAAPITISPPATIVSLLAIATATPASRAAIVAWMPTSPVAAATTMSGAASRIASLSFSPLSPTKNRVLGCAAARSRDAALSRPTARATRSKRSRLSLSTWSVCAPIDPVAPIKATRCRIISRRRSASARAPTGWRREVRRAPQEGDCQYGQAPHHVQG